MNSWDLISLKKKEFVLNILIEQSIASIKKSFGKGNYKLRILCIQLEHKFEGTQGRMKKFNQMRK